MPLKQGRPSRKTPEIVEIILSCLSKGLHVETACGFAKIDKGTFYNWLKSDKDFSTQVEFSKSSAIIELADLVKRSDPQGPWKLLKNIASSLYRDKIENENTDKTLEKVLARESSQTELVTDLYKTTSVEIQKLRAKSEKESLSSDEARNLISLSRNLSELLDLEKKVKEGSKLDRLTDAELITLSNQALEHMKKKVDSKELN